MFFQFCRSSGFGVENEPSQEFAATLNLSGTQRTKQQSLTVQPVVISTGHFDISHIWL